MVGSNDRKICSRHENHHIVSHLRARQTAPNAGTRAPLQDVRRILDRYVSPEIQPRPRSNLNRGLVKFSPCSGFD